MGYNGHRNPSGLHNLVNFKVQNKCNGSKIGLYEDLWYEFDKALKYTNELGYVPETFWEYSSLDKDFIREDIKKIWKQIFRVKYLSIRPGPKSCPNGWKIFTKRLLRYLKEQKKHYAREFFAETIAYWISKDWYINNTDLSSSHKELDEMGKDILNKYWIKEYNQSINGE